MFGRTNATAPGRVLNAAHAQQKQQLSHQPAPGLPQMSPPLVIQRKEDVRPARSTGFSLQPPSRFQPTTLPSLAAVDFPNTLKEIYLNKTEQTERYGFEVDMLPTMLSEDCDAFEVWSTAGINLARGDRYVRSVQSDTISKHLCRIRGYVGWVSSYYCVPGNDSSIMEYANPQRLASFVSYLKARQCRREHVMSHISLARKVSFEVV